MSTVASIPKTGGQRLVLHNVSWGLYESLLRRLSDRHLFLTYFRGTLELLSPSYPHDRYSRLFAFALNLMAEEFGVGIISAGATTLRRKNLNIGLEPDEAFYIAHEPAVRELDEIDLDIHPPPDLAVEVELSRRLGKRKSIYARLRVPELWSFDGRELTIRVLGAEGRYAFAELSPTFPRVPRQEIARFIREGQTSEQTAWLKGFRAYLRTLPA